MAHKITHHSKTDFTLEGHYCFEDENGNWNSNPALDKADTNLMQTFRKAVQTCKKL